jgi:hypothetical protein
MAGTRSRGRIPTRLARLRDRALVAARGETARRLARLAALTVALAGLVVVLYDHGDVPSAAARGAAGDAGGRAAQAGSAADPSGPRAGRGEVATSGGRGDAAAAGGAAGTAGERPPAKVKRPAKPAEVAAAWYAARHKLPRSRVRPLQQDRVSARQVRVLVLAEAANGKLRTALVRVRLGPGGWEVR